MIEDTCTKCSKPKSSQAGSITQWINVCVCDVSPSLPEGEELLQCKTCGKPVRKRRQGSLTQWIFQQDACNCDRPKIKMESSPTTFKQPAFRGFADQEEGELEIESGKFPSERYKPVEILGAGASGTVYLSRDRLLGKRVAVKVLKTLDRDALLSFQNEARTTSKLTHPNIVKVLDFGSTNSGVPFMVMEFVPGSSLEAFIKEYGGLDVDTTIRLFMKLSDALDYAHNSKILHRDLKPSNILVVDNDGTLDAHLIDFGVAKLQHQSTTIYNGTALVGTPSYMSPDQALGREFDKRSDIYSLGCILFETLTGVKAFEADSPLETISLHAHMPPPSILEYLPKLSETQALDRIVETCLAKDPKLRYQNAKAVKHSLQAVARGESSTHADASEPDSTDSPERKKGRTSYLFVSSMLVGLFVLGATVFLLNLIMFNTSESEEKRNADHDLDREVEMFSIGYEQRVKSPENIDSAIVNQQGDRYLEEIARDNPTLTRLRIANSRITPRGFKALRDMDRLVNLTIESQPLTYFHFRELSRLKSLKALRIEVDDDIDFSGLELLRQSRLDHLQISGAVISPTLLRDITAIKTLVFLRLNYSTGFAQQTVAPLANLPKLHFLDLSNSDISDSSIAPVSSFPALTTIFIDDTSVTNQFLTKVAQVPRIKNISIKGCWNIDSSALIKLNRIRPDLNFTTAPPESKLRQYE